MGMKGESTVESDSAPAGQDGERGVWPPQLAAALAGLDAEARQGLAEVVALYREFPAWAVWLPHEGRPWTAVRLASSRAPGPDLPMIWVQGVATAAELAARMRSVDAQLAHP